MHRMVILRLGGTQLHLLKLIGAFVLLGAALMLLSEVYNAMWVASIVDKVNAGVPVSITTNFGGLQITDALQANDPGMQLGLLMTPIAGLMFWAAVLLVGGVIYKSGDVILPIEESVRNMPEKIRRKK